MTPAEGIFLGWLAGFLFSWGQKSVLLKGMTLGLFKTAQLARLMAALMLDAIIWPISVPMWMFRTQDQMIENYEQMETTGFLFEPIRPVIPVPEIQRGEEYIDAEFEGSIEIYEPRAPFCPKCGEKLDLNDLRWESTK